MGGGDPKPVSACTGVPLNTSNSDIGDLNGGRSEPLGRPVQVQEPVEIVDGNNRRDVLRYCMDCRKGEQTATCAKRFLKSHTDISEPLCRSGETRDACAGRIANAVDTPFQRGKIIIPPPELISALQSETTGPSAAQGPKRYVAPLLDEGVPTPEKRRVVYAVPPELRSTSEK